MNRPTQIYCHCSREMTGRENCDRCPADDFIDDDYEEPPLYPPGQLRTFTPPELIKERDRQNRIHDLAVDRCEEINSPTIETAAGRASMVQAELKRRGFNPYTDEPIALTDRASRREAIARTIYDVASRWLAPNFPKDHKFTRFDELREQEQNLHYDYAEAVMVLDDKPQGGEA